VAVAEEADGLEEPAPKLPSQKDRSMPMPMPVVCVNQKAEEALAGSNAAEGMILVRRTLR